MKLCRWYCKYHFFCCKEDTTIKDLQINEQIRDRELRVIGKDAEQLGVMSNMEAQRVARDLNLDLVKISPTAVPPVCKVMDYSKFKYEQNKKEKEMKRNQKVVELKEIWLSMTIDIGDLLTKAKIAEKYVETGNKIKATIRMRGRQQAYVKQGIEVMYKFADILKDSSKIEKPPYSEGRNITMILAPNK
ncbi:MAG: translation initiation factor IF-3 [Clostridia bacterium]